MDPNFWLKESRGPEFLVEGLKESRGPKFLLEGLKESRGPKFLCGPKFLWTQISETTPKAKATAARENGKKGGRTRKAAGG